MDLLSPHPFSFIKGFLKVGLLMSLNYVFFFSDLMSNFMFNSLAAKPD